MRCTQTKAPIHPLFFLLLGWLFLAPQLAIGATSITQYGITWEFDKDYTVGTFINGDYYVVDPGDGVKIKSISPKPGNGRNGSLLNPKIGWTHPYDNRVRGGFDETTLFNTPSLVHSGDAIISTISIADDSQLWDGGKPESKTKVEAAAVLTILSSKPPANSFRPSYVDRKQTNYTYNAKNRAPLLKLSTNGLAMPNLETSKVQPFLEELKQGIQRPWILHVSNYIGRDIHPAQNMYGYHKSIGDYLSTLYTYLVSDLPIDDELLIYTIQLGIDYHHIGINGDGDSSFYVLPSLFAGLMLEDEDMLTMFISGKLQSTPRDYPDFYYWEDRNSTKISKIIPAGETWQGYKVFFRNNLQGEQEHEHLHPSEWIHDNDHWKNEAYRIGQDSSQHVGMVLVARLLELTEKWGHPATFDYIDRWMGEDHIEEFKVKDSVSGDDSSSIARKVARSGSDFVDQMWQRYRYMTRPKPPEMIEVKVKLKE